MQRRNSLTSRSPDSETSDALDVALTKPEDEQLFYTASVHFLRKRLEEKSHKPLKPQEATQSCCNLSRSIKRNSNVHKVSKLDVDCSSQIGEGPSLSMHQVLPFPKSSKDGFFTRLRNTFWKFRRSAVTGPNTDEESAETKHISNFKFPRCSRLSNLHTSCLVQISEEKSNDTIRTPNVRHSRTSKGDLS